MKIEHARKGMQVVVDERCHKTAMNQSLVSNMHQYLGTVQTIEYVGSVSINFRGFAWHPEDLTPVGPEDYSIHQSQKPKEVEPFNPKELDL